MTFQTLSYLHGVGSKGNPFTKSLVLAPHPPTFGPISRAGSQERKAKRQSSHSRPFPRPYRRQAQTSLWS